MNNSILKYSWDISEQEYRDSPALSYSILSRYERNGFSSIPHLREPEESPALLFGSITDSLVLSGDRDFEKRFAIIPEGMEIPADSVTRILEILAKSFPQKSLQDIGDDIIDVVAIDEGFRTKWKKETRVSEIRKYSLYYRFLKVRGDRTAVTMKDYQDAVMIRDRLLECRETGKFFRICTVGFSEDEESFSQLKFRTEMDGVPYRMMADRILVNHRQKTVTIVDLKTTGQPEYMFYRSFLKFRYDIQARLYHAILSKILEDTDYTVNDFLFVAVNRESLNPLIWRWRSGEDDPMYDMKAGKDREILLRSPFTIGKELYGYLQSGAMVPEGIGWENDLQTWINR